MKKTPLLTCFSHSKRQIGILTLACLCFSTTALAQFKVEVSGVGMTQVPIAIATFKGEDAAPQKTSAIVLADLERSGQFRAIPMTGVVMDELSLSLIHI